MHGFTPISSALGGALIGLASALLLLFNGRVAGVSGIVGGLTSGHADRGWRAAFLAGLLVGGFVLVSMMPAAFLPSARASWPLLVGGGLLVGYGTRMGSGCTSGHGVCGLSRLSSRSLAATLTFMGTGFATVYVVRHLLA